MDGQKNGRTDNPAKQFELTQNSNDKNNNWPKRQPNRRTNEQASKDTPVNFAVSSVAKFVRNLLLWVTWDTVKSNAVDRLNSIYLRSVLVSVYNTQKLGLRNVNWAHLRETSWRTQGFACAVITIAPALWPITHNALNEHVHGVLSEFGYIQNYH